MEVAGAKHHQCRRAGANHLQLRCAGAKNLQRRYQATTSLVGGWYGHRWRLTPPLIDGGGWRQPPPVEVSWRQPPPVEVAGASCSGGTGCTGTPGVPQLAVSGGRLSCCPLPASSESMPVNNSQEPIISQSGVLWGGGRDIMY